MKEVSVLLIGVGGYGAFAAKELLEHPEAYGARVVGAVEPYLKDGEIKDLLEACHVPVYADLASFYSMNSAELAILSTPIHLHREQSVFCLSKGSDVLCEKPIAATLDDAQAMLEAAEFYRRKLHIGFQLSFAPSVLKLKEDILSGKFGTPIDSFSLICWPRNHAYFARPWAGKASIDGRYVLDSIVMNACAHYLHNPLFLLGSAMDASAPVTSLRAALRRANPIETYDTAVLEAIADGIPVRFLATHASQANINPLVRIRFTKATVILTEDGGEKALRVEWNDGKTEYYGATYDARFEKIRFACRAVREDLPSLCPVSCAREHLKCVNALSQFVPVKDFDTVTEIDSVNVVPGLDELFLRCYEENKLPAEFQLSDPIDLTSYDSFGGLK